MKSLNSTKLLFIRYVFAFLALLFFAGGTLAETGHEGDEEHAEGHIELSQEQIDRAGISLMTAASGSIRESLPAYGSIVVNAEQSQSVSARFDGVIRDVSKKAGDFVRKGETLATVEANESLKSYPIVSAMDGVITHRDANVGEQTADRALFKIEDLSSVWVELSVFPKDAAKVQPGQKAIIKSMDGTKNIEGEIIYIAPFGSNSSQTSLARVLIDNPDGFWKPGLFVSAAIVISEVAAPLVVRNEAIQVADGNTILFVKGGEGFEPRPVTLGRTDGEFTEVLSGLFESEVYVAQNSFILKSELGKEDAEHGH